MTPWYMKPEAGERGKVPGVIYADDLEGVFRSMQSRYPHAVTAA